MACHDRGMRRIWIVAAVGLVCGLGALVPAKAKPSCPPVATAPRYPAVEPMFARKCVGCHDARKATNAAAQRVFEMSSYPFATERPATLLRDLRGMFVSRGGLSDAERCAGLAWIDGGGLDASGKPPRWR
jgi:hypothetical protein